MPAAKTEERHDKAKGLDIMHPALALRLLAAGQQAAAKSVDAAIEPDRWHPSTGRALSDDVR